MRRITFVILVSFLAQPIAAHASNPLLGLFSSSQPKVTQEVTSQSPRVGVLGDVEGQYSRLDSFLQNSGIFTSGANGYELVDGAKFVFLGDSVDRGPNGRKIWSTLLELKEKYPDRVFLILGNRDINKLRISSDLNDAHLMKREKAFKKFLAEQAGETFVSFPQVSLATRLRFFFSSIAAPQAFEFRRQELQSETSRAWSDDEVVQSIIDDLKPDGLQGRYLLAAQLAYFDQETGTLFAHGSINENTYGFIPGAGVERDPSKWVSKLNAWAKSQIEAGLRGKFGSANRASELINYQRYDGNGEGPGSIVTARYTGPYGLPRVPAIEFIDELKSKGVVRIAVGHTPYGEIPILLKENGFEVVFADTSYNMTGVSSAVVIKKEGVEIVSQLPNVGAVIASSAKEPAVGRKLWSGEIIAGETLSGSLVAFEVGPKFVSLYRKIDNREFQQNVAPNECALLFAR